MTTAYSTLYHHDIEATKFSCKNNSKEKDLLLMKSFWLINDNNNDNINNTLPRAATTKGIQDIQRVSTLPTTRTTRKLSRNSFSFDSSLNKIHFNNCQDFVEEKNSVVTSTPRVRKTSSVLRSIIRESIDMEVLDDSTRMRNNINNNNNNNNNNTSVYINGNSFDDLEINSSSTPNKSFHYQHTEWEENSKENIHSKQRRSSKKVYKHRKHHSDFGIAHLQFIGNDNDEENEIVSSRPRVQSHSSLSNDAEDSGLDSLTVDGPQREHSKSDSNLDDPTKGGRMKKSNSHVDITTTQMYKDIYADNLRQYGFLLAKVSIILLFVCLFT